MRTLTILVAMSGLALVPGCNTIAGIGEDIALAGRGVSYAANDVRDQLFLADDRSVRTARTGEPCDPSAGELDGGSGLPACPGVSGATQ